LSRWHKGDIREDGKVFESYRTTPAGARVEHWLSPVAWLYRQSRGNELRADYQKRAYADPVTGPAMRERARVHIARLRIESPARMMLTAVRAKCKRLALPFNLELADIVIPTHCPVLGIELRKGDGVITNNSPSLDRIHPAKGYTKGNVLVVSHLANRIKSDATPDEIRQVADFYANL
jgi:hypothetical protein